MNSAVNIIVEGQTERSFIKNTLAPYMSEKGIYLTASLLGKPGHKGGNVKFERVKKDIGNFLKQRKDTYVSIMLDYFGIDSNWHGKAEADKEITAENKANVLEQETFNKIEESFSEYNVKQRFIPYFSMFEFEALLFSDVNVLAEKTGIGLSKLNKILEIYKDNPEEIDKEPEKAPGKRLVRLKPEYRKVITGKVVAEKIGIEKIRKRCSHFNNWLKKLEAIKA